MNVLAIAGSLRAASINAAFCRAAARLAPPGVSIAVHPGLGTLPLFNPDLEAAPPRAVVDFRGEVGNADALLIASPEHAHAISGVMKNALDCAVPGAPRSGIIDALNTLIDKAFADRFAAEWIEAWNAHDLDAVLAHYDDDFEMSSPFIVHFDADPSGRLRGKARVAAYWEKALG